MRPELINKLIEYIRANPSLDPSGWKGFADGIGATAEEFSIAQYQALLNAQQPRAIEIIDGSHEDGGTAPLGSVMDDMVSRPTQEVAASLTPPPTPVAPPTPELQLVQQNLPKPVPVGIPQEKKPLPQISAHHYSISQVLLGVGIVLIAVAILIIVGSSWPALAPWQKFLAVALPNIILLVVSTLVKNDPTLRHVRQGSHGAGLLMLPLTIGVGLFQFGAIPEVNEWLMLISLLCVLPFYIYYDMVCKEVYATYFTILNAIASLALFLMYMEPLHPGHGRVVVPLAYLLLGCLFFGISWVGNKGSDRERLTGYECIGALLVAGFLPALINALAFVPNTTYYFGSSPDDPFKVTGIALLNGLLVLAFAGLIGKVMKPERDVEFWLQRVVLLVSLWALYTPFAYIFTGDVVYAFVVAIFSAVMVVLGATVGIAVVTYGSMVVLALALLDILFKTLSDISLPLSILIVGLGSIGLSILVAKRGAVLRKSFLNQSIADKLGLIPDSSGKSLSSEGQVKAGQPRINWVLAAIVLGIGWQLLTLVPVYILQNLSGSSSPYASPYPDSTYTSPYPASATPYPTATPASQVFQNSYYKIYFKLPAGWQVDNNGLNLALNSSDSFSRENPIIFITIPQKNAASLTLSYTNETIESYRVISNYHEKERKMFGNLEWSIGTEGFSGNDSVFTAYAINNTNSSSKRVVAISGDLSEKEKLMEIVSSFKFTQ